MSKKIEYGISEVRRYSITRYYREDSEGGKEHGGAEPLGEYHDLATAEKVAKAYSESEPEATWFTVPSPE